MVASFSPHGAQRKPTIAVVQLPGVGNYKFYLLKIVT